MMRVQRLWLPILLAVLLAGGSLGGTAHAQPDSVRAEILERKGFSPDHSPTGALWRSAAVPGWGQSYNRQYYKVPFVYAGLAALAYRIVTSQEDYRLFKRAHLFGRGREISDGEENPYQQYRSQYNKVVNRRIKTERLSTMRDQRDQFRRQRDLAILGMGLFYALNVLDAYVSAHLLTFDVGDTLDVRVHPVGRLRPKPNRRQRGLAESAESIPAALSSQGARLDSGPGMHFQIQF